jgi:phosphoglycolate phosphatase
MPLFAGVREGLADLNARGYLLAIATGKARRGLTRALHASGIEHLFVASRCADEAFSKPHPQMLLDILERTGMDAAGALMVGDTVYDLQMASSARVDAVAVSYGVHARDRLLTHAPLACLGSFSEVHAWLN